MANNLVNVNLCYIEIELCIAQLRTQVRGNILAVSISGAALPYSAVWPTFLDKNSTHLLHFLSCTFAHFTLEFFS